ATLLTEGLVKTKRHLPETDRMVKALLLFNAVVLTTLFISFAWARLLLTLALGATVVVSLLLAVYGMKRGVVHARYYLVSFIF
ncbi:hypothetical protein R0K17_28055, partial [Planococcus sp. SIMBA_143]